MPRLTEGLRALRAKVTQRLGNEELLPDAVGAVDVMAAVDRDSFYLDGWLMNEEGTSLNMVAGPRGEGVDLTTKIFRYFRPDVRGVFTRGDHGVEGAFAFACFFRLDTPRMAPNRWWLKVRDGNGLVKKLELPPLIREPRAVRDSIVARLKYEPPARDDLMKNHVAPALSRLQRRLRAEAKSASVIQYGPGAPQPAVSMIVPIRPRLDFVENQLSQFALDPKIREADVIYVLDSPELAEDVFASAPDLFELYRVPFRIALLERPAGYAGATNVGASLSRGRFLLLLHSDVLPGRPGWIEEMRSLYEATPNIGTLGPKLLFEDDTIQHVGLSFRRAPGSPIWETFGGCKGLHRNLRASDTACRVPAVTGACLMTESRLFDEFGGLRGEYVEPDSETLDFQLRLWEGGFKSWIAPDVELYHLEGPPSTSEMAGLYARYDSWLRTRLWDKQIKAMLVEVEESAAHTVRQNK
jgi:GT2 family glycosyltransferase